MNARKTRFAVALAAFVAWVAILGGLAASSARGPAPAPPPRAR